MSQPRASSSPLWATTATLHASSVSGQGIFCCVLHPFLVIHPWGTWFVDNARRIVSTLASPAAPQYSCVRYLFNSTDKYVPQTHIKVLSKQSLASYRGLLPATTESGSTTPCPLATHRDSRSVCKIPARSFKVKSNIFSGIKSYLEPHFCPALLAIECPSCWKHTIYLA